MRIRSLQKRFLRIALASIIVTSQILTLFVFPNESVSAQTLPILGKAKIEVRKTVVGLSTNPDKFNLYVGTVLGGPSYYDELENVGNGGTTGQVEVYENLNVTISETAFGATKLDNYTTSLVCTNQNNEVIASGNPANPIIRGLIINKDSIHTNDVIVCQITNTAKTGTLVVRKILDQQTNGGEETFSDFSFTVSGHNNGSPINFEDDGTNSLLLPFGVYTVNEEVAPGYTISNQNCVNVEVKVGSTKECTITNTSDPAYLTVTKVVDNTNGGNAVPDDFGLTVNGKLVLSGQKKTYLAGTPLTVNESTVTGYDFVSITGDAACPKVLGGQLTLKPGDDISCVITNKDIAPVLTIVKNVINDNGGNLTANDFGIKLNNAAVSFGAPQVSGSMSTYTSTQAVTANTTLTVSEQDTLGYSEGSWSCTNDDIEIMFTISLLLEEGGSATCTVTNNDQAPALMLIKNVVNDFGGLTTADAWTLIAQHGDENPVIEQSGMLAPNSDGSQAATPMTPVESGIFYELSESNGPAGYVAGEWTCEGGELVNGAVRLIYGTKVFCSITNTEVQPTLTVVKYAINDNGGMTQADEFTIYVNNEELSEPETGESDGNVSSASYELPIYSNEEYNVSENEITGYENTAINCFDITNGTEDAPALSQPFTATSGMRVLCEVYNDDKAPVVHVTKYTEGECKDDSWYDKRSWCEGEQFDFTMNLDGEEFTDFSLGNGDEFVTNQDMQAGTVEVLEAETDGWFLNEVYCYTYGDDNMLEQLNTEFVTQIGKDYYCDFYNEKAGEVVVTKFHDYDEDGEWDEGEPALSNWEMTLTPYNYCDQPTLKTTALDAINQIVLEDCVEQQPDPLVEITDESGDATFTDLRRGRYEVDEVMQDGWIQSSIYCENNRDELSRSSSEEMKMNNTVYVQPGQTSYCYIGNYREPQVTIEKTNSTTAPVLRGTQVTFTMVVTVPGVATSGILHGTYIGTTYIPVTVNDGFTNEFEYITGSFTAVSSVRGDLKVAGIVTDPNYASPGTWNLTSETSNNVIPGEIITLTYKGIVEATAPAASYKTVATVTGYGDDITVSVSDTDDDQVIVYVPAVLGSSTTKVVKKLASTGSEVAIAVLFGSSIVLSSWFIFVRSKKLTAVTK